MQLDPFGRPMLGLPLVAPARPRPPGFPMPDMAGPPSPFGAFLGPDGMPIRQAQPMEVPPTQPEVGPNPMSGPLSPGFQPTVMPGVPVSPVPPAPQAASQPAQAAPQQTPLAAAADRAQTDAPRVQGRQVPGDIYALAQKESDRTGIPVGFLLSTMATESGFNPQARNPQSTAGGVSQLLLSTATNPGYGVNPISDEDRFDPKKAVPFMADYMVGRGRSIFGDAFDPKNPQHLAMVARAYGPGTPEYVRQIMDGAGMDWTPADGPAPQAGTTVPGRDSWARGGGSDLDPAIRDAIAGMSPDKIKEMFGEVPDAMSARNVMLGIAAGLLKGPTLGAGLGTGIENVLGLTGREERNALGRAQAMSQALTRTPERLLALGNLEERRAGMDISRGRLAQQDQRIALARDNYQARLQGLGLQGDALRLQMDKFAHLTDEQKQEAMEQAKQEGATRGKMDETFAQQRMTQTLEGVPNATKTIHEVDQALALLNENPSLAGTTITTRVGQALRDLGFIGNPNDASMLDKIYTDIRNASLSDLTNGHVGGIRSNAELQNLSGALADRRTNPEAGKYILELHRRSAQRLLAWNNHIGQLGDTNPSALAGRNFKSTERKFMDQWDAANPLPTYQRPAGGASPAPAAAPASRPTSGSLPGGVTWESVPD